MRFGFSGQKARQDVEDWIGLVSARSRVCYQSKTLNTSHGLTHVLDSGDAEKPAMIFLPGWGTCGAFWDLNNTLHPLAEEFRLILVDLPGQPGLSTEKPLATKGPEMTEWLSQVLDELRLPRAHFAGCSFGGFVLLQVAPNLKYRMESLTLAAPAGLAMVRPQWGVLPSLVLANLWPTKARSGAFLSRAILGTKKLLSFGVREQLDQIVYHFQKHYRSASLPPRTLSREHCEQITVPTFVVCGTEDRMICPNRLQAAAHLKLPKLGSFVVLDGHGHSLELSSELVPHLLRFADRAHSQAA